MVEPVQLALYQPDIPQNTGAILRTTACLGVRAHIIEPCGFVVSDKTLRRAGMDYLDHAPVQRHVSWSAFLDMLPGKRLVLMTTKGPERMDRFTFEPGDILLMGRESSGVPDEVHARAEARVRIPLLPNTRSLNLAAATAMVLGEALRQLGAFPQETDEIREGS